MEQPSRKLPLCLPPLARPGLPRQQLRFSGGLCPPRLLALSAFAVLPFTLLAI
ncbi:protein of unknown function [Limnospira indica PCC 8005]|uniref:Uncharacterized protein n=1 Tax=Limnospira indica PCC 8005 TaxID=376219 RepID=A0A9P1KFG7_9CYAN|nr:protein of unknown function [Limnospira indica PCC 8005]